MSKKVGEVQTSSEAPRHLGPSFAWNTLSGQGLKLVKDGKQLATDAENLAELDKQATEFADKWLPIMKSLGISK